MIWATVSSRSCFCWLSRASPSSAAKNIINLISVLTICQCPYVSDVHMSVMSICRVFSCVVGGCLLWPVCSLGKTLLAFALLHFVSKAKFACYSRCFLTSYLCISFTYFFLLECSIFFSLICRSSLFLKDISLHLWYRLQFKFFLPHICFFNVNTS